MAEDPVRTRGDETAVRRYESKRSSEGGQAQDPDHDTQSLENEAHRVQSSRVMAARPKQRGTECAEVGGDPDRNAPAYQRGWPANTEQDGRPESNDPHAQPDDTTGLDRISDVDDGEDQPEDRPNCARSEMTKRGCCQRVLLGPNLLAGIQR